jgi:FkbM family methyltransferase
MGLKGLKWGLRNPQGAFFLALQRWVCDRKKPYYNDALYEFCRRYVNYYRNDETGDREANGAWRWLREFMSTKPKVILDVGGFNGEYALKIVEASKDVQLHVFEPDPESFKNELLPVLQRFPNARLVQMGMSDKKGKAVFFTSKKYAAMNSLHDHGKADRKIEVELTTVDAYCAEHKIPNLDLLKIDTEGHDLSVIKGAERMLREGRVKCIVFEFGLLNTYSHDYFPDFTNYLSQFGFVVSKIMPLGTVRVREPEYERTQHAYFVATRA